jgi:hypothetical protein
VFVNSLVASLGESEKTYALQLDVVSIKHRFLHLLPEHGDNLTKHFQIHGVIFCFIKIINIIAIKLDMGRMQGP